ILQAVRQSIRQAAPSAQETISYQIPTFRLNGKALVHFGGWKHHIGLYPVPDVDEALEEAVAPYRSTKSTLRFPLQEPVPYELIARLVAVAVAARQSGGSQ